MSWEKSHTTEKTERTTECSGIWKELKCRANKKLPWWSACSNLNIYMWILNIILSQNMTKIRTKEVHNLCRTIMRIDRVKNEDIRKIWGCQETAGYFDESLLTQHSHARCIVDNMIKKILSMVVWWRYKEKRLTTNFVMRSSSTILKISLHHTWSLSSSM